jgi:outer membrane protein TolC
MASAFRARSLADSALLEAVRDRAGAPDGRTWTAAQLAVAGVERHAAVAEARAAVHVASAAEITAGARPRPDLLGELGYAADPGPFESPWYGSVQLAFRVELGGKRGARLAAARSRTAAAEVDAVAAEWRVAWEVHRMHAALVAADSQVAAFEAELAAMQRLDLAVRERIATGEASGGDAARVASARATLAVERDQAATASRLARQELARALAIPSAAVETVVSAPDAASGCVVTRESPVEDLEASALLSRAELGRALADYAAAEADLRLEAARSWPDLLLGPGVVWDGGVQRWNLLAGLPGLPLDGNRGPIAEAAARRALAAIRVDGVQQTVLADVARARTACAGALAEVATADSALATLDRELEGVQRAQLRGERGTRDVLALTTARARAARVRHAALGRVTLAGIDLEGALGRWLAQPAPRLGQARGTDP